MVSKDAEAGIQKSGIDIYEDILKRLKKTTFLFVMLLCCPIYRDIYCPEPQAQNFEWSLNRG